MAAEDDSAERWDVIVVGAGLSGLAAAHSARRHGGRVLLIDRRSQPQRQISPSLLRPDLETWLEKDLGVDPRAAAYPVPYRGLQLCVAGSRLARRPAKDLLPGRWYDRERLLQVLRGGLNDELLQGTACGLEAAEDGCILKLRTSRGERVLRARVVIDASGRRADGLPDKGLLESWRETRDEVALFEAELFLEATGYEPGWLHIVLDGSVLALVQALESGLALRVFVSQGDRWPQRWFELATVLSERLKMDLRREVVADFHWLRRPTELKIAESLGGGWLLRVGEAGSLGSVLGASQDIALRSGAAAGWAALGEDPARAFAATCSESGLSSIRLGREAPGSDPEISPLGDRLSSFLSTLTWWRRWAMRRQVLSELGRLLNR